MANSVSQNLKGTGVALVTPFNSDFSVDYNGLKKLVEHQIANGTNYLVIMGTTGESPVISDEEKKKIIDLVKETNNSRLPLLLGIGGNHTLQIADKMKAQDIDGFSAFLSVSPYYNKPNQEGIFRHYTHLADNSPLPILLYNVPGRTGSNISAETTLRLAEHANILGTKEASGNFNQCMEIIAHKPENFSVISGDDAYTLPFISIGMDGVISVIANAFPAEFSSLVKLALEGDFKSAGKLHYQLLDSMNLIFADGSPGGIKVILEKLGICGTTVRMPLHGVNDQVKEALLASIPLKGRV